MMNLTIGEIAEACGGALFLADGVDSAANVSCGVIDSRQAGEGALFFAVKGERVDGHKFVSQVFANGALAAVVEKTPEQAEAEFGEPCKWGSYILVENTLEALKKVAEFYRVKTGIPVVGITGSVGKTSTKEFIAGVLAEKFNVLKTEGNFNNEIGVPLTLLRIRPEHELAVVEMGISDFGEMHRLSKMARPDVCVITNIGQCHLENLIDRDGVLRAKSEIFDFCAENAAVVLNGDDDKLRTITAVKGMAPHFFGMNESDTTQVYAKDVQARGLFGSDAVIHTPESEFSVRVSLPGFHMVLNSVAATCVARRFGLTDEQIAAGIEKVKPVAGRANLIAGDHFTILDDCYNANPGSMRAALDLLSMADTEKVAILGDMFELGENAEELHAGVGTYAAEKGMERIICVGEMSAKMYEAAIEACVETKQISYFPTLSSLLDCLREAREEYVPDGCTVLIKASHGMHLSEVLELLKEV